MTINESQDEVIAEFDDFTDWMDKYQMLIDLGNDLEPLDARYKTEQNLIDGCQSRVWLQADYKENAEKPLSARILSHKGYVIINKKQYKNQI